MPRPSLNALTPFFRSATQAELLHRLVEADDWVAMNSLLEVGGSSHQTIRTELSRLVNAGLVERSTESTPHRYRFATGSPIASALREIVIRTIGVEPRLRQELSIVPGIVAAAIHGSWATRTLRPDSDVDVLLLVNEQADEADIRAAIDRVERVTGRPIDPIIFRVEEARERLDSGSGFLRSVVHGQTIPLIGDLGDALNATRGGAA